MNIEGDGPTSELYFRLRPDGATVFRVVETTREHRLDMVQIANVNLRNGTVRPAKNEDLTQTEETRIHDWIADRQAAASAKAQAQISALIDRLGLAAHWLKADATDEELAKVERPLLLAMHDVRRVIVRRKSR